ncbi:MAG TPA: hypothetical protein VHB98_21135 [Chloroflexota bacterium]|nr:hypothetical protein [Chloroflexota bacterium]
MGVNQPMVVLVILLSLVASIGLGVRAMRERRNHGPVYRVAPVASRLSRDLEEWLDHTLLVRGVATVTTCTAPATGVLCWSPRFTLSDAERVKMRDRLDLAWTGGGSLLTFLRRLPVVRAMAPRSQMVRWGLVTVYRVQLLIERPCSSACYEAVLQDATP